MSLTDLEIKKHTDPIRAELDRQKEKAAKFKREAHEAKEALAQAQRELEAARSGLLSLRKQVEYVGDYRASLQGFIDKVLRDTGGALSSDAGKGYISPDEAKALAEKVREVVQVNDALLYGWNRCTHEGIGQPGCPTCDPDKSRCLARANFVLQKISFTLHGAVFWGFDPNTVTPDSVERVAMEVLAETERLRAEIRRLQTDLATVRAAHGCKGRCLK